MEEEFAKFVGFFAWGSGEKVLIAKSVQQQLWRKRKDEEDDNRRKKWEERFGRSSL